MAINKNKIIATAQRFVEKGQYDRAIKEYLKVVEADPKDVRVWLKIGDLHARLGEVTLAADTYAKVAGFYTEQGFYLKAVAVHKQILKLDPRRVESHRRLAGLYKQLGLLSDALHQLEAAAAAHQRDGQTREALQALRESVDLDPESIASRIKLAELCSKEGMSAEAIAEFTRAVDFLRTQNRTEDMIKVAERLIWHQPDNLALTRELAALYLRRSDPRRALQKLQVCFKGNPHDVDTLLLLTQAFEVLGQTGKAVSVLKEVARLHHEAGRPDLRDETWRKVQVLDATDSDAKQALARGEAEQHPAVPAAAAGAATAAVGLPGSAVGGQQAAGRFGPAGESGRRASSARPEEELAEEVARILTEADVYVRYGLIDKAIEHLRKVFKHSPDHLEARDKLKDLLLRLGQQGEACEELGRLVGRMATQQPEMAAYYFLELAELDPEHPALRQHEELLRAHVENMRQAVAEEQETVAIEDEPVPFDEEAEPLEQVEQPPATVAASALPGKQSSLAKEVSAAPAASLPGSDLMLDVPSSSEGFLVDLEEPEEQVETSWRRCERGPRVAPSPMEVAELPPLETGFDEPTLAEANPMAYLDIEEEAVGAGSAQLDEDLGPGPLASTIVDPPTGKFAGRSGLGRLAPGQPEDAAVLAGLRGRAAMTPPGGNDDLVSAVTTAAAGLRPAAVVVGGVAQVATPGVPGLEGLASGGGSDDKFRLFGGGPTVESEQETDVLGFARALDPLVEPAQGGGSKERSASSPGGPAGVAVDSTDETELATTAEEAPGGEQSLAFEDYDTRFDLGVAYREMGLLDEAIREFDIASHDPARAATCHLMIGLCHADKGQLGEAITELKRGLYVEQIGDQEALSLYYELGQVHAQLGEYGEALYYFERVQRRDPTFREVQRRVSDLCSTTADGDGGDPPSLEYKGDDIDARLDGNQPELRSDHPPSTSK